MKREREREPVYVCVCVCVCVRACVHVCRWACYLTAHEGLLLVALCVWSVSVIKIRCRQVYASETRSLTNARPRKVLLWLASFNILYYQNTPILQNTTLIPQAQHELDLNTNLLSNDIKVCHLQRPYIVWQPQIWPLDLCSFFEMLHQSFGFWFLKQPLQTACGDLVVHYPQLN